MAMSAQLQAEYAARRAAALRARDARVEALYARSGELRTLDAARAAAIWELGPARLHGEAAAAAAQRHLEALTQKRRALLASLGADESVYEAPYTCVRCADTGFVGAAEKKPCACLRQRLLEARVQSSNLPEEDRFERFRTDIYPDEKQRKQACRLRDACLAYAESFPEAGPKGIVLMGSTGLGKSFLLRCIARRVIERGYNALNITFAALMRAEMERIRAREAALDYTEIELLVLDDLGVEPAYGEISVNTLLHILSERENRKRPTLIATNLSPAQIRELYGERIYSRIVSPAMNSLYRLEGTDLRLCRHV